MQGLYTLSVRLELVKWCRSFREYTRKSSVVRTRLLLYLVSTILLPFFRFRFAVPVSRCRFRTPLPLPLPLPYALARRRRWLAGQLRNRTTKKQNSILFQRKNSYGCNGTKFSYVVFTEQRNITTAERRNGNGRTATECWKPGICRRDNYARMRNRRIYHTNIRSSTQITVRSDGRLCIKASNFVHTSAANFVRPMWQHNCPWTSKQASSSLIFTS